MADSSESSKIKVIETQNFNIRGHLLEWSDTAIQISNISTVLTAELPLPKFPMPSLVMALIGLLLVMFGSYSNPWGSYGNYWTKEQTVGILLICGAAIWIVTWLNIRSNIKGKKYLNIVTNSGQVYSFFFEDQRFLRQVLQVFSNIFESGTTHETNFSINVHDCQIRENGSVIQVTER